MKPPKKPPKRLEDLMNLDLNIVFNVLLIESSAEPFQPNLNELKLRPNCDACLQMLPILMSQPAITNIANPFLYDPDDVLNALRECFVSLDSELQHLFRNNRRWSGSTCTATIITPAHIFTANLGDSRTLLVQSVSNDVVGLVSEKVETEGIPTGVRFSTSDHKIQLIQSKLS